MAHIQVVVQATILAAIEWYIPAGSINSYYCSCITTAGSIHTATIYSNRSYKLK